MAEHHRPVGEAVRAGSMAKTEMHTHSSGPLNSGLEVEADQDFFGQIFFQSGCEHIAG